jgi:hypothetical protein
MRLKLPNGCELRITTGFRDYGARPGGFGKLESSSDALSDRQKCFKALRCPLGFTIDDAAGICWSMVVALV